MEGSNSESERSTSLRSFLFGLRVITAALILVYGGLWTLAGYTFLVPARHPVISVVLFGCVGTVIVEGTFWYLTKYLHHYLQVILIPAVFVPLLVLPISTYWPGGITHAEFGWTVVGLQPVPGLDVTISGNGVLWFRTKDHTFHQNELKPYANDAEVVIVGTGWQETARVDEDLPKDVSGKLIVRSTGEAIKLYKKYRNQEKRVALLLHTTC